MQLHEVAVAALEHYDLDGDGDVAVRPVRVVNNAVFEVVVNSRDRFALRVHRDDLRSIEQTRVELETLQWAAPRLERAGVALPRPVPTENGELLVEVPTGAGDQGARRRCDLLTWVNGVTPRFKDGLAGGAAHELGRALACLHETLSDFVPPTDVELPRWDETGLFNEEDNDRAPLTSYLGTGDQAMFDDVVRRSAEVLANLCARGDGFGLVHGDYILGNTTLTQGSAGWSAGIVDFNDLGWGSYLYDVATMMGNLSDFENFDELRNQFLRGYRSERELPNAERDLPLLMAARHAACCVWAANRQQPGHTVPPRKHIAIRLDEIRRCLSMRL